MKESESQININENPAFKRPGKRQIIPIIMLHNICKIATIIRTQRIATVTAAVPPNTLTLGTATSAFSSLPSKFAPYSFVAALAAS